MRPALAAALFCLPFAARAKTLEVVGFSPDGAYLAIVEHGVGEGSGLPYANLSILEVAKSAQVSRTEVNLDQGTEADAVAQAKSKAEPVREKLHIAKWLPARVIAHDDRGQLSDREGAPLGVIEIKTRPATAKQRAKGAAACDAPFAPLLLNVKLFLLDDDQPKVLANESKVPRARACTKGCALDQVYAFEKSALFVLKCASPGFEGESVSLWPITSKFEYGLDEEIPAQ